MSKIISITDMHVIVGAIRDHCTIFSDVKVSGERELCRIGTKLYAMNFIAVKMATGRAEKIPPYAFEAPVYANGAALGRQYVAVTNLLGQCEGDVRQTPAYVALDQVRLRLALELADEHPAVKTS